MQRFAHGFKFFPKKNSFLIDTKNEQNLELIQVYINIASTCLLVKSREI